MNTRPQHIVMACALVAALLLSACSASQRPQAALYQTATIDALMEGMYDGEATVGELLRHGDFGIGTFDALDGEMVILGGNCYRVSADGVAREADADERSPFAVVTFFQPQRGATAGQADLAAIEQVVDQIAPERNLFCAVRIDGLFEQVRTRSVPRQSPPYPRLADVAARQPTFDMAQVEGTLVGFRCPYFVKGVNVPGYHFHFITRDLSRGGHVLSCRLAAGAVRVQVLSEFNLSLPHNPKFAETPLGQDRAKELEKVEKGRE